MAKKNKYINLRSSRRGGRRLKKSVMAAAVILTAAVVTAAVFAVKAGTSKGAAAVSSSGSGAQSVLATPSASKSSASSASNPQSSSNESKPSPAAGMTSSIPVLMYHSINYEKGNCLRVPKEKFAAEMKWLHDNGYTTLSLDEVYDAVSNNKKVAEKSVVLTFDDGYKDNYESAFPVIKQYGFKATVFMITSEIGDSQNGYLTAAQIKEMDKNGMRVECHTVDHPDLSTLSYKRQYSELSESKAALEALLGRPVNFIAYPSGMYNSDTIEAAKKAGYKMCFKMKGGIGSISDSRYEFPRFFVGESLQDFISRVEGTADYS
jgi:peptidoglycan/xylan/chitin deacetylase (PgdA/CDA1 family)